MSDAIFCRTKLCSTVIAATKKSANGNDSRISSSAPRVSGFGFRDWNQLSRAERVCVARVAVKPTSIPINVYSQSCSQANVYFCCSLSLRSFESNHSSPSQAYHSSPTILVQVKGSVSILEGTVRYVFPTPTSGAFRFCGIPVQALVPGELRGIVQALVRVLYDTAKAYSRKKQRPLRLARVLCQKQRCCVVLWS